MIKIKGSEARMAALESNFLWSKLFKLFEGQFPYLQLKLIRL